MRIECDRSWILAMRDCVQFSIERGGIGFEVPLRILNEALDRPEEPGPSLADVLNAVERVEQMIDNGVCRY